MRTATLGCMALLATIFVGAWALTHTSVSTSATPAGGPAAMNPHDMMKNPGDMPVQIIVDLI